MAHVSPLLVRDARYLKEVGLNWRPLRDGDVFRELSGDTFYVEYTNSSGAYCISLRSMVREINGKAISFTSGGKTISANSIVQIIHPLELGGNSPEFARYVKMEEKKGRKVAMAKGTAATFADFEDKPLTENELVAAAADGPTTVPAVSGNKGNSKETGMAKKAAAAAKKANGSAARERTPKTVRKCACGCGGETTGHFRPGHDARFHGWIKKLASGKIDISGKDAKTGERVIPLPVVKSLDLVATKEGAKAKAEHFYKA